MKDLQAGEIRGAAAARPFGRPAAAAQLLAALAVAVLAALVLGAGPAAAQAGRAGLPFFFAYDDYRLADAGPDASPYAGTVVAPRVDPGLHDDAGVRMRLAGGRLVDYPGGQASWGTDNLNSYLVTGDPFFLQRCLLQADRLVATAQHVGDAWFFPSLYRRDRHNSPGEAMVPPWYSCLGQGEGLSLFSRLYETTGEQRWADAAAATFAAFLRPGPAEGPWLTTVDETGHLWFEEWPLLPLDHTLNGHTFAAFGVYDYWRVSGDERARLLFDGAATTVRFYLPQFRRPGWRSAYCLLHKAGSPKYHVVHTRQLLKLATLTGDLRFARFADALYEDYPDPAVPAGRAWFAAGTYAACRFDDGGRILGRRALRVPAASDLPVDARQRIHGRGIYLRLAGGPLRGRWVLEQPGRAFALGATGDLYYYPSRHLELAAGVRYVGVVLGDEGSVVETRPVLLAGPAVAHVARRAAVAGVDSFLVTDGPLAGCWVPAAGLTLD